MSHSWLESVPNDPPQHDAKRPTVVCESSDPALAICQTRSCGSPQKPPSPHERVTRDCRSKAASKNCPTDSAKRGSSTGPSHSAKDLTGQRAPLQASQPYPSRATGTYRLTTDFVSR
ncbi:hypothetical protein MRX96_012720 [Rhipicephalus microplus]